MNILRLVILICLFCKFGLAQTPYTKGITPMHKFFQKFADSTLIIEYAKNTSAPTDYQIIIKTNDTVNCFIYYPGNAKFKFFTFDRNVVPKVLGAFLGLYKDRLRDSPADINIYFDIPSLFNIF